jgi:hypothetical protein
MTLIDRDKFVAGIRSKLFGGQVLTHVPFATPLKGTAATLLEFVTLTASVTGAVFFNAQGYQGA